MDVDACGDVAEKCEISCMPTFHFYKGGDRVKMFEGANADMLTNTVAELK